MHEGLKKLALENISSSIKDIVKLSGSKVYVEKKKKWKIDYDTLEDAEKYDGIYVNMLSMDKLQVITGAPAPGWL